MENLDPEVKKKSFFKREDLVVDVLAFLVVIGFFLMAFLIAVTPRDDSDHDVLNMLIGQMSAGFIAVLSYFFGSARKPR